MKRKVNFGWLIAICSLVTLGAAIKDEPFKQDLSVKFKLAPELSEAELREVEIDGEGVVYVLTSKGLARLRDDTVALDRSYRPLAGQKPVDITVHDGALFYLMEHELFSQRRGGTFLVDIPPGQFSSAAVGSWNEALVSGSQGVARVRGTNVNPLQVEISRDSKVITTGHGFAGFSNGEAWILQGDKVTRIAPEKKITALESREMFLYAGIAGEGYASIDASTGKVLERFGPRLPFLEITSIAAGPEGVWCGGDGAFLRKTNGEVRYYSGKRWLDSDQVKDIALDKEGNAFVLTKTGLNKIEFRTMTLAQKAEFYQKKIRQNHLRYGFCAELMYPDPSNPASVEMIDTDNDGTWNNYYLASLAFRYAATGDEEARKQAWETYEALERLHSINPLEGFPSRTFERSGFKMSDPDRWHTAPDKRWEWKAHTSSDEIIAHTFGSAVMYETVARTGQEKQRVATFITSIADHLIANNWYLVDVDGKPTLWGRWNPEYVNWYPFSVVDRRLNSAELVAILQFSYAVNGKASYKEKAEEMLYKHGYLENIMSPMNRVARTAGYVYQGADMGSEWNHSDDLLGFVCYWVLHRFALNEELKKKFAETVRDHWEIEKREKNPLWNFVYASTGANDADIEGGSWILRRFPLDLRTWTIRNSHRKDITLKEGNFRKEELEELLPPSERQITRWNTQPFIVDGGWEGRIEFGGDEFLLPYWMGRYLKLIE